MAGKNDFNIRAGISGKEAIKNDLGEIVGYVENLTNKLKTADFSTFNRLADKLSRADFGTGALSNMEKISKQASLTRQEAMALTYTFNDVTASLASGISPMTILLQQSGQLSQAFGGIRGTISALGPQLLKWGPAIAAAGAAAATIVGSFNVLSKGADAAKKMADLADATERTRISQEGLNKIAAGLIAVGVPQEQALKMAEELTGKLRNTLVSAKDAQVEFNKSRKEFAKTVQAPRAGENPFDQLEQAGKFLKTVRVPSEVTKIGTIGDRFSGLKDFASKYNIDATKIKNNEEGLFQLIQKLTEAYNNLGSAAKKAAFELDSDKFLNPKMTEIIKRGGLNFLNQEDRKAASLGPRPTSADVKAGQDANIIEQQNLAAEQNKQLVMDSRLISSSRAKAEARQKDLADEANSVSLLNQAYQKLGEQITTAYQIKSGDQQAIANNPEAANVKAHLDELGMAAATAATSINTFSSSIASSISSLFDSLRAAIRDSFAAGSAGSKAGADYSGGSGNSGFASGGLITGPGGPTSDNIPIMVSPGEFIVKAAAVRWAGLRNLHALNAMRSPGFALAGMSGPRRIGYASGGLVPPSSGSLVGSGSNGRGLTLVLDNKTFGGFSGSPDAMDALERYAIQRRLSSTTKRTPSRVG